MFFKIKALLKTNFTKLNYWKITLIKYFKKFLINRFIFKHNKTILYQWKFFLLGLILRLMYTFGPLFCKRWFWKSLSWHTFDMLYFYLLYLLHYNTYRVERVRTCPPFLHVHCVQPGVMSSIPPAASWSYPGCCLLCLSGVLLWICVC